MSTSTSTTHPTAEQVTTQFSAQIHNKTILLTGVSPNGLGLTIAKTLAQHSPRLLILTARSLATLQAVAAEITCPLRLLPLDLSSQSNVRAAAAKVQSWDEVKEHGIDILINNAGIMSVPWGKTEDGVETQFAVNHLGPFLFTNLLMPSIIATKGRVVFTSSVAHVYSGVRFEDVNFDDGKSYDPDTAYGQSKTASILTATFLASKLQSKGVTAFSVHPGLVLTNLTAHIPMSVFKEKGFVDDAGNLLVPSKTHSEGAATTLVAALDPNIADRSGAYLCDCKVDHEDPWAEHAKLMENAEKLWALSEKLLGMKVEYYR